MSVFVNSTKHVVHMVGYRADGLKFEQNDPDIEPGQARYVNQDHFGDMDWYIMVAYMKDANIPDRIGVTQATEGAGGSVQIGVTVAGNGGTISAGGNETKTVYFSDGMGVVSSRPHQSWELVEEDHRGVGRWGFTKGGHYTAETLHGW